MRRLLSLQILAGISLGMFIFTAVAVGLTPREGQAAGPHIDLYFMSAVGGGSPLRFCTGTYNPPMHSPYRAIDVLGDDASSLRDGANSSATTLRSWGFGGSSSHHTMTGFPSRGINTNGCGEARIGMIDVQGGLDGELVWLHTSRTRSAYMQMYAGPSPGVKRNFRIGSTTFDTDGSCGWTAYHVHQGTAVDCMALNGSFSPATTYDVWDVFRHIHAIDYAEGLSACDG